MAAAQEDWTTVIDEVDAATAQLIVQCQLDDITALQQEGINLEDGDQQTALQSFRDELQHHHALRSDSSLSAVEAGYGETSEHVESQMAAVLDLASAANESVNRKHGFRKFFVNIGRCIKDIFVPDLTPTPPSSPTPPVEVAPPVETFMCEACEERFNANHCWQAPCQHWYCDEDLTRLFHDSMNGGALYPPRCCRQHMPFEDVRPFLHDELAEDFLAKKEELDETQPTYCHVPTCSTYLGQATKEGTKATCPACGSETCVLCKQGNHTGDCAADEAMQETERLAHGQGWQRCINCRRFVELDIGCNHMTCLCNAEFCYVCGLRWKTCQCALFDEEHLLARGQQVAGREGREDVAAVVEEVRVNHECHGRHYWDRIDGAHRCEECRDYLPRFIFRCTHCRLQACRRCRDNVL